MITFSMNKFSTRCKQQGSQRWIVLSSTRFFSQPRRSLCSSAFRFQLIEKLIQTNIVMRRFELQWLWPNANPLGRFPFLIFSFRNNRRISRRLAQVHQQGQGEPAGASTPLLGPDLETELA
ncbi:MAG: hypothetical protein DMF41_06840 [Verrucomicrobia bacterium]|nr:MAG: hypothetical protein DMF41_06840 [Verrucomicrobiota bacterium]